MVLSPNEILTDCFEMRKVTVVASSPSLLLKLKNLAFLTVSLKKNEFGNFVLFRS